MFLSARTIRGYKYLYMMKSVYDKKKKKFVNKIHENYGRYDKAPEEIRKAYENQKEKKLMEGRLLDQERSNKFKSVVASLPKSEQISSESVPSNFNRAFALNYGHLPLKVIWEKELGLKYKIDYLQKTQTTINNWQLNDLLFYLCSLKLICPRSYLSAVQNKANFFYCPWQSILQDNFYRGLDFVYQNREQLLSHAVKHHLNQEKRQIEVAFFDCTNTWFETPYDDLTRQIIQFTRDKVKELKKLGLSHQIDWYMQSEQFIDDLTEHLDLHKDDLLRMRGHSKEGRFAQPIVTVALAIDQTGFPIDCKVFAGNLAEIHTVVPILESLEKKYQVKDIYFVADKGLNSAEKLEEIQSRKLGFVVAQKVSNQKQRIRAEMMDLSGYHNYEIEKDGSLCLSEGNCLIEDGLRFKVCPNEKIYRVATNNPEGQEPKTANKKLECYIIYTFSPQRRKKDLRDLENQISKAQKAVTDGLLLGNQCGSGWRSLLETKKEAAQTKEDKELFRVCGLKQQVIEERRNIAGYSAIVFAHPTNEHAEKLSDLKVMETYHRLVAIEDSFRTMKSSFSIRPVHVRLHDHVVAHCYLCVLSLMMLRIIQSKLSEKGIEMSGEKICEALRQAMLLPMVGTDGEIECLVNLGLSQNFFMPSITGKGREQQPVDDIEKEERNWDAYYQYRKATPFDIDRILETVGLEKLDLYNSVGSAKKKLKILSVPVEKLIAPIAMKYALASQNS